MCAQHIFVESVSAMTSTRAGHCFPFEPPVQQGGQDGRSCRYRAGSFVSVGNELLQDWLSWGMDNMSDANRCMLMDEFKARPNRLFASICSGTESPLLIWGAYLSCMSDRGLDGSLIHQFSCEINAGKREFMKSMFEGSRFHVQRIFNDEGSRLWNHTAVDTIGGCTGVAADADELWAGFPCQDVSRLRLSALRQGAASVVRNGNLRTGSVFKSICHYIESRPLGSFRAVVLENVMGLMDQMGPETSNLDSCIDLLGSLQKGAAIESFVFKLSPTLFGFPVVRWRLYILGIPKRSLELAHMAAERARSLAQQALVDLTTNAQINLDDLLLDEDHPSVVSMLSSYGPRRARKRQCRGLWAEQHAQLMQDQGIDWWEPSWPTADVIQKYPGLQMLTDRQMDIVRATVGMTFPGEKIMCDLSQSMGRARPQPAGMSCIVTPKGKLYLGHRCRFIHGIEALHLQGLHFGSQHPLLVEHSSALLQDLAGNSFHVWCAAAVHLTKELVLARLSSDARKVTCVINRPARSLACEPADEDY